MEKNDRLFREYNLYQALEASKQKMIDEINDLDADYLLSMTSEELCAYFQQRYEVEVPQIIESGIYIEQSDTWKNLGTDGETGRKIRQPGTEYSYHIPFQGDKTLFYGRPSSYRNNPPHGEVEDGLLIIKIFEFHSGSAHLEREAASIKKNFESDLAHIRECLEQIKKDVAPFNLAVRTLSEQQIEFRRKKFLKDKEIAISLGFPLKRRKDAPAPIVRKKLPISRPLSNKSNSETFLEAEEYEHILSILNNMAMVMERSPIAFQKIKEEDLRWHFLFQLNGHYEGQATGETFNSEGKTDILIRAGGKNIFMAECKFWKSPKGLTQTIDQLLGYTSWRDTKTAILLFNRNKNFSDVLSKIPGIVKSHPNYKRDVPYNHVSSFRYIFHHKDDKNRELTLTIMAFEVPA